MAIELNGVGNHLSPRVRGGEQSTTKSSSGQPAAQPADSAQDRVQLSSQAQRMLAADHEERFDENKVAALKQQIEEGRYQIDPQQVAASLLRFEADF
ncbi:flagellar biosynthesis anti-sigma factor FlgM [Marinospirillum sp.]|uniref:flagellar biosynthesis anti-sigma factor FlgM n=1 Tax=Marinospirillum sp. TaxID=2183934 RepID=UPI003A8C41ED